MLAMPWFCRPFPSGDGFQALDVSKPGSCWTLAFRLVLRQFCLPGEWPKRSAAGAAGGPFGASIVNGEVEGLVTNIDRKTDTAHHVVANNGLLLADIADIAWW